VENENGKFFITPRGAEAKVVRKRFIGERDCHCPAAAFNISKWLLWQILRLYYIM